jgi:hypothetical protein
MEPLPWLWFGLSAVFGLLFWVFLLWLAWVLATSVKGMREELERIRKLLEAR